MSRHEATTPPPAEDPAALHVRERTLAQQAKEIHDLWYQSRFPLVREVCDDLSLVTKFVEGVHGVRGLRTARSVSEAYRDSIRATRDAVREVGGAIEKIDQSEPKDHGAALNKLIGHEERLLTALRDATAALRDIAERDSAIDQPVREQVEQFVDRIDHKLAARGSMVIEEAWMRRLMNGVHDGVRRRYDERAAAAREGAKRLGHAYDSYAKRERRSATALRWVVGVLAVGVAALALWFHRDVTEVTLDIEVARLSATVPLGLLAVYLAKESTRHRAAARHTRELAIALQTVDDYTADAEAEDRRALRQTLGMRAFGAAAEPPVTPPSDPDLLQALLTKLTETVSSEVLDRLGLVKDAQKGRGAGETKPAGE